MSDNTNIGEPVEQPTGSDQSKPIATLLSSISYTNEADYKNFLENITPDHAVLVLIAAANHSQSRGIFTLAEAELLSKAIKRITEKPVEVEPE